MHFNEMKAADYRLVRSHIQYGIMMAIKRTVFPRTIEHYFSSWLYGEKKSIEQISIDLPRSIPCLVCSHENISNEEFSLLTVDMNLFLRCLSMLNNEQLSILYSLLYEDEQSYENVIREQYRNYKQYLLEISNR
ncbi:hypothetical protein I4U23_006159 [Adineta vaga]|nr:hypothetical protein I4U23_006159 [Adineta vaga]